MNLLFIIQITALTAIWFNAALTILVLARDFRSRLCRIYLGWWVAVTLWNLGVFHLSKNIGYDEAFFWAKVLQLGVIFIPVILLHLCLAIGQAPTGWLMPALYLLDAGLCYQPLFQQVHHRRPHAARRLLVHPWPRLFPFRPPLCRHHRLWVGLPLSEAEKRPPHATQTPARVDGGHHRAGRLRHQ